MTPTPENKAILLQRLENHIRTVVGHFGDDVYAWDVVNEVIDPSQSDGFRRSPWFNITGTEYIDRAFRVAREVAPNARLYINDFSTTDEPKRSFLRNLVRDLLSRGVPIDGIGHQMHSNIEYPSAAAVIDDARTSSRRSAWTTRSRSSTSASTAARSRSRSRPTKTSRRIASCGRRSNTATCSARSGTCRETSAR